MVKVAGLSSGTLVVNKIDPGEIVGTLTHEDERENRLVSDLLFLDDGRFVSANANEMSPDASTLILYLTLLYQ